MNVADFVLEAVARILPLDLPDEAVSQAVAAEAEHLAGYSSEEFDGLPVD